MQWPFANKQFLALTSDNQGTMLAEVGKALGGKAKLRVLAETDSPITTDVTLPRLIAGADKVHGRLAVTLPLALFETAVVNLPPLPDGAVGKALPYHLAKAINKSLNDLIYDWQISGRYKDRLQVTAYLFPSAVFQKMRRELLKNQIEIAFFEPDIFAAFAFLDREKMLPADEATLCLLLWQDTFSLAVHEKGKLPLARSVRLPKPSTPVETLEMTGSEPAVGEDNAIILQLEEDFAPPPQPQPQPAASFFTDDNDLLSDFSLISSGSDQSTDQDPGKDMAQPAGSSALSWPDYLQQITLEILRTRDYYASIQKGSPIKHLFIGGANDFWPELQSKVRENTGLECRRLCAANQEAPWPPLQHILAIGTGQRW